MLRMWSIGLAAGVVALTVLAVIGRIRSRTRRGNELGTVSGAWLHNPRSFPPE